MSDIFISYASEDRESVEQIRLLEVKKASKNLDAEGRAAVDSATRAVVNKILHGPIVAIKDFARQQERDAERLEIIKSVFSNLNLDDE